MTAKNTRPSTATGAPWMVEYWLVVTLRQLTMPPPAGQLSDADDV